MSPLDGFEAMPVTRVPGGRMGLVMQAFLDSGQECMGKAYDDEGQLGRDLWCARQSAKRYYPLVGVHKCGNLLVLQRKGAVS